jgi:hypothetical protein
MATRRPRTARRRSALTSWVMAVAVTRRARQVRAYERDHKNRAGVIEAAERELSDA